MVMMGLFADAPRQSFKRAHKLIEKVLGALGANPKPLEATATDDGAGESVAWQFTRGSAVVTVFLNSAGAGATSYVRAVAPIVRLPDKNVTAAYRRLLELNAKELVGFAFGLIGEDVVLVAERSTADLDESEVEQMLRALGDTADHFDDKLAAEFAAERSTAGRTGG